jgi:hypothetical protein
MRLSNATLASRNGENKVLGMGGKPDEGGRRADDIDRDKGRNHKSLIRLSSSSLRRGAADEAIHDAALDCLAALATTPPGLGIGRLRLFSRFVSFETSWNKIVYDRI